MYYEEFLNRLRVLDSKKNLSFKALNYLVYDAVFDYFMNIIIKHEKCYSLNWATFNIMHQEEKTIFIKLLSSYEQDIIYYYSFLRSKENRNKFKNKLINVNEYFPIGLDFKALESFLVYLQNFVSQLNNMKLCLADNLYFMKNTAYITNILKNFNKESISNQVMGFKAQLLKSMKSIGNEEKLLELLLKDSYLSNVLLIKDLHVLKNGDLLFNYHLPNFFKKEKISYYISKFGNSYCSHVGIYYEGMILEANFDSKVRFINTDGGVRLQEIKEEKNEFFLVFRNKTNTSFSKLNQIVEKHIDNAKEGHEYSYDLKELLGWLVYKVFKYYPSVFKNNRAYFCSEFVHKVYLEMGINLTGHDDSNEVSPKDILESKELEMIGIIDGHDIVTKDLGHFNNKEEIIKLKEQLINMINGSSGISI